VETRYLGEVKNSYNTLWQIYSEYAILSESAWFYRRCDNKHLVCFVVLNFGIAVDLTKSGVKFYNVV